MKLRIEEIGALLDPLVRRDRHLRRSRVADLEAHLEKSLAKGLSFDVTRIESYNPAKPQTDYVPYLFTEDGQTVVPYPVEHWQDMGKLPEHYETTRRFYRESGIAREDQRPLSIMQGAALEAVDRLDGSIGGVDRVMRSFRAEVDDTIRKATFATSGGVPLGTVHRYRDGNWYRKVAPGEWKLVSQPKGATGKQDDATKEGHAKIEADLREKKILGALDRQLKHRADLSAVEQRLREEFDAKLRGRGEKKEQQGQPEQGATQAAGGEPEQAAAKVALPEKLQAKVRRLGAGQGREVNLTKDELFTLLDHGTYGLISAGRAPGEEIGEAEVKARDQRLKRFLVQGGYAYSRVTGHYGGTEDSFLVMAHHATRDDLLKVGRQLKQESVIYAEGGHQEMHFVTGPHEGQAYVGDGYDEVPGADDLYTVAHTPQGDVKFTLNFDFEHLVPRDQAIKQRAASGKLTAEDQAGLKEAAQGTEEDKAAKQETDTPTKGAQEAPSKEAGKPAPDATTAPGDDGLPKQFEPDEGDMTYFISGKDLDLPVAQRFIQEFERDFVEMDRLQEMMTSLGAKGYCSRLKGGASLLEKMHRGKFQTRSLNTVTDIVGSRAVVGTLVEQKRLVNYLRGQFKVVEVEDFAEKGRPDTGYRAAHLLLRTSSGRIVEFQVKTLNQQFFSHYMHDAVYKGDEKVKLDPEVKRYALGLSEYLARMDRGEGQTEEQLGPRPKEPKALKEMGALFPWDMVERGELTDQVLKAEEGGEDDVTGGGQAGDKSGGGSERFFVLTRRGGKTLGIEDYGTLTEARSARQRLEESNPDVDYPLVAAPDEATLFAVFPEYRQEEDEGAEETKAAPVEKSYERYVPRFRRPA